MAGVWWERVFRHAVCRVGVVVPESRSWGIRTGRGITNASSDGRQPSRLVPTRRSLAAASRRSRWSLSRLGSTAHSPNSTAYEERTKPPVLVERIGFVVSVVHRLPKYADANCCQNLDLSRAIGKAMGAGGKC